MTFLQRATILLSISLAASPAAAETPADETVIHDTTSWVEVKLDASTVLCSAADYGALFLKVGIPELAKITLLDHQNVGAGAPCVAAGMCEPGNMPEDIIDPAKPTELVSINVKAIRFDAVDPMAQTCSTHLIERVNLTIRGTQFTHERFAQLGTRPLADCATQPSPVAPDDKTDSTEPTDDDLDEAGGCSTTGSSSLAISLGALGALLARRRRSTR